MKRVLQVCLFLVLALYAGVVHAASVNLVWDASTSQDVTGYMLHYGPASGAYTATIDVGNQTTGTIVGLTPGAGYFIAATAYDATGTQSGFSNEVFFPVPLPQPTGLVAAYGFENGSGTTLTDVSGSGNHGTIAGATWTTQGKFGQALAFDGVDDWVTIADAPSLGLTTAMTVEAWVNPGAQQYWRTVIQKEAGAYFLYASSDSPLFPAGGGTGTMSGVQATYGSTALPVDTWTHLAVTYDGAAIRLYVNGIMVSSLATSGALQVTTNPLRLGGNINGSNEYFLGRIDEVRIYSRVLTAAEIQTDMQTPVLPAIAAPVADFTGIPTTGVVPLAVAFANTTTGIATSWSWNFGDGATSTAQHPSYTYPTAGTYTVALIATGPGGSHATTKTNYVTVTTPVIPAAPTAFRIVPTP